MSISFVSDLPAMTTALQRFMVNHAGSLPEFTREKMIELASHPSPVDRVVGSAEALYAIKGDLSKEGRDVAAQLSQFAAMNGWHGMSDRGVAMAAALQRIGGYSPPAGSEWPDAESDPDPKSQYLPDQTLADGEVPPAPEA